MKTVKKKTKTMKKKRKEKKIERKLKKNINFVSFQRVMFADSSDRKWTSETMHIRSCWLSC